jgi:hypothetical protein
MSFTWGPAIDAEVSYRQQRVRADYHRAPRKHFLFHHDKANRHPAEAEPVPALSAIPLPKQGRPVAPVDRRHAA